MASGDPAPDGAVIWTRLAPHPLADDGLGGMPGRPVDVEWEVASDERFSSVAQRGITTAMPEAAHSVHVELVGLQPGADYFYRFRSGGFVSPTGRTRTTPAQGSLTPLTMCVASCSNYEQGWFTAYRRLAQEYPDLIVHLGDYQYEYAATGEGVREHVGPETVTLANYRQRYAQYKTDADLQAAHAVAPWLAVFDDHELANNWADEVPDKPSPGFLDRRAAALQAHYENMPLRSSAMPHGIDMQLYRRVQWGDLATMHMLDTRQYRTDQPCGDEIRTDCVERILPFATLTGPEQERWLLNGFQQSRSRWDILGQQVFFSQVDLTPGPGRGLNPDAWDGYTANRDRIIEGIVHSPVRNAVVLTGDIHSHWAAEVHSRFDDPVSPVVATELVTTSISSGGDGSDMRDDIAVLLPENPHIRYYSGRRGYVRAHFTAEDMRADFRVLPYVSRPGAAVQTEASFVVPDRAPALHSLSKPNSDKSSFRRNNGYYRWVITRKAMSMGLIRAAAVMASAAMLAVACGTEVKSQGQPPAAGLADIATGLDVPWGIAYLPDGSALIAERNSGAVKHLTAPGVVTDVGGVAGVAARGEGGLLGLATSGQTVFAYLTTAEDNRVVRMDFDGAALSGASPILTGIPAGNVHDGGRIALGPDGKLYVATGEVGDRPLAQDRSSLGGKILRINLDGSIPPDNPDPASPIWSYGHRNIQGLAWDAGGRLWATEYGANRLDELNLIQPGGNYGWPMAEGRSGTEGLVDPLIEWPTGDASPSGLAYFGGSLWVACLRGERLYQIPVGADGALGQPSPLFVGQYGRLRTVVAAPDGTLWFTTSNRDGRGDPRDGDDRILEFRP